MTEEAAKRNNWAAGEKRGSLSRKLVSGKTPFTPGSAIVFSGGRPCWSCSRQAQRQVCVHKEEGKWEELGLFSWLCRYLSSFEHASNLRSQENHRGAFTFSLMEAKLIKKNEKNVSVLWIFPVAVQWRLGILEADYNLMRSYKERTMLCRRDFFFFV